jgi:hypothetical protein
VKKRRCCWECWLLGKLVFIACILFVLDAVLILRAR